MNWNQIRSQFPVLKKVAYFNTAANGLLPQDSVDFMCQHLQRYANNGSLVFRDMKKDIGKQRRRAAELINADPEEIAFVPNVSVGMHYLTRMLRTLNIIAILEDDFPTVRSAWEINNFPIVNFRASDNGYIDLSDIEKARADILALSHVQWHTGFKIDIDAVGRICRDRGQIFILDATQSLGNTIIDVKKTPVDILLASSYKWLMGGFGCALMYVRKELLDRFPVRINWQYWEKDGKVMPNAERFEIGHERFHNIFQLGKGIDMILNVGKEAVAERVGELNRILRKRLVENGVTLLSDYPEANRSAITMVKGGKAVFDKLQSQGVEASLRGRGIRLSMHFYNSEEDIDRLVSAHNE